MAGRASARGEWRHVGPFEGVVWLSPEIARVQRRISPPKIRRSLNQARLLARLLPCLRLIRRCLGSGRQWHVTQFSTRDQ